MLKPFWYLFLMCLLTGYLNTTKAQTANDMLNKKISIHAENLPVKEVLNMISEKTGIGFSYSNDLVQFSKKISLNYDNKPLKQVLDQLIANTKITYSLIGKQIVFQAAKEPPRKHSISGYVEDKENSEKLIGAYVFDSHTRQGGISNSFGYFSLSLPEGQSSITAHYFGYEDQTIQLQLNRDTCINFKLVPSRPVGLAEVRVFASMPELKLTKPQLGMMNINSKDVKKIPVLLGEADVMRAMQILPGIQAANERSSGISVRGGSIDQNLYLLDDAPIFQISHMVGFYSVFNNDAVKDIKIYKGDIPANYGGRISSLVDVRLKDGNMQKIAVSGGIGLVSSSLNVEGPIIKDKVSFSVSGKYAYSGRLLKFINKNINISFYDFNCKLNAILSNKSRVYLSSYIGGDDARIGLNSRYQNNTVSLRWNYVYTPKLFSNVSLIYSNYNFKSGSTDNTNDYSNYTWQSGIRQITLKAEYNYYFNNKNTIDFGASTSHTNFNPGKLEGNEVTIGSIKKNTPFSNRVSGQQAVLEHAIYASNQQKLTDKLTFKYGVRASLYQNLGGHWVYRLNDYQVSDSFYVAKNHTYANSFSVEPRLGINYRVFRNAAIKASYTYTSQQTQLLMKTTGGGPLDVWFPSGVNIKPQTSSQFSAGYVHYLFSNLLEASIETYYKKMNHIIDYKDGATFLNKTSVNSIDKTNYNFEEQLRTGKGEAYGGEFMLKFDHQRIDGFASYTYSRSKRIVDGINSGRSYLSPFDRPHTFNLFLNWNLSKRLSLSCNFRHQSGQVTTVPLYTMDMFGKTLKGFGNRNEYRLPYYQRLDLSLTLKNKQKARKRYHSEWNFAVVNALNYANISYIEFVPSKENPNIINAKGISMLGLIPSVSYHFNF
jgi:hypothetical protein